MCSYLPGIWKNKNTLSYCETPKGLIWYKWNHFIISILPHWIKLDMKIDTKKLLYFPQRKSWSAASSSALCESSVEVQKHTFPPLQFTISSEHKMVFLRSQLFTLWLYLLQQKVQVWSWKKPIQSEPLKAQCCIFLHSCMAETWARSKWTTLLILTQFC